MWLVHLWQKRDTPEARKLFRYTMVSVISTVVSFGVLGLVFGVSTWPTPWSARSSPTWRR